MYHSIVKKIAKGSFEALNKGDYEKVLKSISPDITHTFRGNHPLGGTRVKQHAEQ